MSLKGLLSGVSVWMGRGGWGGGVGGGGGVRLPLLLHMHGAILTPRGELVTVPISTHVIYNSTMRADILSLMLLACSILNFPRTQTVRSLNNLSREGGVIQ